MAALGSKEHCSGEHTIFSRFSNALSNAYKKLVGTFESQIKYGRTPMEMPALPIVPMDKFVVGCNTGPYGGLCQLHPELDHATHDRDKPVAGVSNWYRPQPIADGESITLYEHKPGNMQHHGDPIADVYSIVLHPNSCVLAVADGVNWGIKPRLAARCAMHGYFDHLNKCLYASNSSPRTTQDIFHCILRSFHSGQKLIIQHGGTTTTLCAGVVVELQEQRGGAKWGLCIVSVGDSLCYLWRDDVQMVYEITSAMHMGKERNPRDCGGCLGCDLGDQPDLTNLLCFFVPISDNDVVFIVSDGVSDNFDPVILKEALAEGQPHSPAPFEPQMPLPELHAHADLTRDIPHPPNGSGLLPVLNPDQRQALCLMKLTHTLKQKLKSLGYSLDAQDVKDAIINYVIEATEMKRDYLEHYWVKLDRTDLTVTERRLNESKITKHIKLLPGKLDHATIAAYKVGKVKLGVDLRAKCPTHSYMTKVQPKVLTKTRSVIYKGGALSGNVGSDTRDAEEKAVRKEDGRHPRDSDTRDAEEKAVRKEDGRHPSGVEKTHSTGVTDAFLENPPLGKLAMFDVVADTTTGKMEVREKERDEEDKRIKDLTVATEKMEIKDSGGDEEDRRIKDLTVATEEMEIKDNGGDEEDRRKKDVTGCVLETKSHPGDE